MISRFNAAFWSAIPVAIVLGILLLLMNSDKANDILKKLKLKK